MVTVPYGPEFTVSNGVYGAEVAVASDTDRFMLVWEGPEEPPEPDEDYNNEYSELYGRAYSVLNPLGGVFQVNTEMGDPQVDPDIISYGDGSYLVAYASGFDDSLPGTSIVTQRLDVLGNKLGPEVYSSDYSYEHNEPDVAVLADGRSVVVSQEEFTVEALVYSPAGAEIADYDFGSNYDFAFGGGAAAVVAHPTLATRMVVFWEGYTTDDPDEDDVYGLYWQQVSVDVGPVSTPQLIEALPVGYEADPSAITMQSDVVNVVYNVPDGMGGRDIKLYSLPFDGISLPSSVIVNDRIAGDQLRPTIDAIDADRVIIAWEDRQPGTDDAAGSAIRARVLEPGSPSEPSFLVNQVTAGDQAGPSVAQVDEGIFVVAWTDGDGVKARLFNADGVNELTSHLITRLETQDGSDFLNQQLRGFTGPQSFFFEMGAETGDDRVLSFGRDDVLLTDAALFDGNGDRIITFAGNRVRLDGPVAGSDTVRLDGLNGSGLRYIGQDEGLFVYATASVRPAGAKEVLLGSAGVAGSAGADLFFYDAALDLPPDRSYALTGFGANDVLVTTAAIADSNGDGRIGFGADRRVEIGGSDFSVTGANGRTITALEFDGSLERDGVTYFVYSLVGSAAGTDALGFG